MPPLTVIELKCALSSLLVPGARQGLLGVREGHECPKATTCSGEGGPRGWCGFNEKQTNQLSLTSCVSEISLGLLASQRAGARREEGGGYLKPHFLSGASMRDPVSGMLSWVHRCH